MKAETDMTYFQKGKQLEAEGKLNEALSAYSQAIKLNPNNALFYQWMGNALTLNNQLEEALASHRKVSQMRGWDQHALRGYEFPKDFFTNHISNWKKYLNLFAEKPGIKALEIGSFQGMSSCWLLDNILTHPSATITCIDPFWPSYEHCFDANIAKTNASSKVIKLKGISENVLSSLQPNFYDFIYIDGNYASDAALYDAVFSWKLLKVGGIIIFDDYLLSEKIDNTKTGIDLFLSWYESTLEVIYKDYQVFVKKRLDENLDVNFNSFFKKANELYRQGQLEEATVAYKFYQKLNPNFYAIYHNLGEVLAEQGRLDEAVTAYRRAVELNPNSAWSHHNLKEVLTKQGDSQAAVISYPPPIEQKSYLSDVSENPEKTVAKINQQNPVIEIDVRSYEEYIDLAKELKKQGKLEEALNCYFKAILLKPDFWKAHNNLYFNIIELTDKPSFFNGVISHKGDLEKLWEKIRQFYVESIDRFPRIHHLAYLNLGDVLTLQGNPDETIEIYLKGNYQQILFLKPDYIKKHWNLANSKKPQFLMIGCTKCGTTSLYNYLIQHPKILPSLVKEIQYFYPDSRYDLGDKWYLAHFPPVETSQGFMTGEATIYYIYCLKTIQRIYDFCPTLKLIVMLRNPTARAISNFYMNVALGSEKRGDIEAVMMSELEILTGKTTITEETLKQLPSRYLAEGVYVDFLKHWMNVFPKQQFLILQTEELAKNPEGTMKQVFNFLGVSEYRLPSYERLNEGSYSQRSDSLRQKLAEFFKPHNQRLEEFLGRKFNWD
ncbi:tetratricopeptide repeat protein [Ancylothrix sp. C2]|uniref:tetratricopeptide repeat protein n=1 Tax=Ancylothrix sp. D3o TaxID=2953691 RepID=UPI0021BABC1A|nr:tetratricopeptide repeat protein [Ancylothrix sp. D3o]MCT7952790.1 tetratricopeptide repeat protein [Ancylothrix sp. D3o]